MFALTWRLVYNINWWETETVVNEAVLLTKLMSDTCTCRGEEHRTFTMTYLASSCSTFFRKFYFASGKKEVVIITQKQRVLNAVSW